ncbi:RusA family crossover junction endodeoxyribonuclease [Paucilactobacillus sp. N302-9]
MKLVIHGELPSLNEYINVERSNRFGAAKFKKQATYQCMMYTKQAMQDGFKFDKPSIVVCTWYTKNLRKDPDNVSFAIKFIFDGMMKAGLIENDGRKTVLGIEHKFEVDKIDPRVEVELKL